MFSRGVNYDLVAGGAGMRNTQQLWPMKWLRVGSTMSNQKLPGVFRAKTRVSSTHTLLGSLLPSTPHILLLFGVRHSTETVSRARYAVAGFASSASLWGKHRCWEDDCLHSAVRSSATPKSRRRPSISEASINRASCGS
jgi:hypothetical protein